MRNKKYLVIFNDNTTKIAYTSSSFNLYMKYSNVKSVEVAV